MEKEVLIAIIGAISVIGGALISSGIISDIISPDDKVDEPPVLKNLVPINKSSQESGTVIKWIAEAEDKDDDVLYYRFQLKVPSGGLWAEAQDWSSQNWWDWSPSENGNYKVRVSVRDGHHSESDDYRINSTMINSTMINNTAITSSTVINETDGSDGAEISDKPPILTSLEPNRDSTQEAGTDIESNATTEKEAEKVVPAFFSEEDPAVAASSWGEGRLDLFVRGIDGALYHRYGGGSSWSAWERLDGELTSAPAAVSWGPGRIDVFALGNDSALWHIWGDGSTWSDWESLGGNWTSAPAVSSAGENSMNVFVRGEDNALWHIWWDGSQSKWGSWESFGGELTSAPAAVSWGPGRIDVFARGKDNDLIHRWYASSTWSDWESVDGILNSAPSVSSPGEYILDVFIRGEDNALYIIRWDGQQSKWGSWQPLGGELTSAPAAVYSGSSRTDIFARGTNNTLVHKWWDVPKWAWSGFETIGKGP